MPFGSALVLSAAAALEGVAAASCNTTALLEATMTGNGRTCGADSGYSVTSFAIPTNAQLTAICNSNACNESIDAVKQVAPEECTIGPIRLYADLITPLSQRCGMSSGSAGGAGSASVSGSASASGSGCAANDDGSTSTCASMSGSTTEQPTTNSPQPNTRSSSSLPSSTTTPARGNGGANTPTLSTCAAIAVLAALLAAIL